jgi:hypothetical protein
LFCSPPQFLCLDDWIKISFCSPHSVPCHRRISSHVSRCSLFAASPRSVVPPLTHSPTTHTHIENPFDVLSLPDPGCPGGRIYFLLHRLCLTLYNPTLVSGKREGKVRQDSLWSPDFRCHSASLCHCPVIRSTVCLASGDSCLALAQIH